MLSSAAAALAISAAVFLTGAGTVDPPASGGPWRQLGGVVTSRPGKLAHCFRSAKPIRLTWFTYCEFESDDAQTEQNQATVTGVRRVSALPHVLDGATLCNVSVTIRVAKGRAAAAIFTRQASRPN